MAAKNPLWEEDPSEAEAQTPIEENEEAERASGENVFIRTI